jgi:uncharacterized protein YdeI (YjbR/CyaY-like superfamily)
MKASKIVKSDKRVDTYIAKSAPFARPILEHLRALVHRVCPECEEKMKWSFPHFDYKGEMMCSMAAFKEHASFGFWKETLLADPKRMLKKEEGMGSFSKFRSLTDLPSDAIFSGFIRQAMKLNDAGTKISKSKSELAAAITPDYLTKALKKHSAAKKVFDAFSPSNKREYIQWLTDAKTEETREKRLATALEWMAEGKIRNWKYVKK